MTDQERAARSYLDYFDDSIIEFPCTCRDDCPATCRGECGCKACQANAEDDGFD